MNVRQMAILQGFAYSVIALVEILLAYIWIHTDVVQNEYELMLTRHIGIELWSRQGWLGTCALFPWPGFPLPTGLGIPLWWIMILLLFSTLLLCQGAQQSDYGSVSRPRTKAGKLISAFIGVFLASVIVAMICAWHPPPNSSPHAKKRLAFQGDCIKVEWNRHTQIFRFQGTPEIYGDHIDSTVDVPGILYCGNWSFLSGMQNVTTGIVTQVWSLEIHVAGLSILVLTILVFLWFYRHRQRDFGLGFPVVKGMK